MRRLRSLPPWLLVSAPWVAVAGLSTIHEYVLRGGFPSFHDWFFSTPGDLFTCAFLAPMVFVASRRWPVAAPRVGRRLALHAGLAALLWAATGLVHQGVLAALFNPHFAGPLAGAPAAEVLRQIGGRVMWWTLATFPFGAAVYLCIAGLEHATRYFVEAREREVQVARMSEQLAGARYSALQAQLNPHFLFNALNTIAVRARDGDGPGTARMVEQLSELLRRTLARHRANETTLGEELELVRQYLAIEQARFPDRLRPAFAVDDAAHAAAVPSFALQHLVENAVRHGVARRPGAGRVRVVARRDRESLEASVVDDGIGVDDAAPPAGHGLENTRERLRALYGERASLVVARATPDGTVATLRIPYRELVTESERAAG